MKLLAIAYPELSMSDFERIQNYRKQHDALYYKIVKPHFTFVFPVTKLSIENFAGEIKKQLTGAKAIPFVIRCSTINKDVFNYCYHTFLTPDEGYSRIVKLHDLLYSDKLMDDLRLDIDYIPHIGIGNSKDKMVCKKMVDEWNKNDFEIKGTIKSVDIVSYENNAVTTVEKLHLIL